MQLLRWVDSLRQDHALLCKELVVLEKAQSDESTPLWQTLRNVCSRLSTGLREHIQREEQLLRSYPRSLGAAASETMTWSSSPHYSDYRYLQAIMRYLTLETRPFLLNSRYQLLMDFLRTMQSHIRQQEAEFFPESN